MQLTHLNGSNERRILFYKIYGKERKIQHFTLEKIIISSKTFFLYDQTNQNLSSTWQPIFIQKIKYGNFQPIFPSPKFGKILEQRILGYIFESVFSICYSYLSYQSKHNENVCVFNDELVKLRFVSLVQRDFDQNLNQNHGNLV